MLRGLHAGPLPVRSRLNGFQSSRPSDRSAVSRCGGCDPQACSLGVGSERVSGAKTSGYPPRSSIHAGYLLAAWRFEGHSLLSPHDFISPWLWEGHLEESGF